MGLLRNTNKCLMEEEEEFTDEQFLAWLQAYSDDVEEAGRKYKAMQSNNKDNSAIDI